MPSSESLLRTDSLSSIDPVLSDGSVGSAPSLGLSPGPTSALDMNRTDMNCGQDKMKQKDEEVKNTRNIQSLKRLLEILKKNMLPGINICY